MRPAASNGSASERLVGVGEDHDVRPALGDLVELADVVVVVVGEQHVRRRRAVRSAASNSGSIGPPASTKNARRPASLATR